MSFNKKYFIAVSIIILLLISNQIVIQYWLNQKRSDANIINISGKQRMLSQKVLAQFYDYQLNPSNVIKDNLENTLEKWSSAHQKLLKSDYKEKIEGDITNPNEMLDALTAKIDTAYSFFYKIEELSNTDIKLLKANQNDFLFKMDTIVLKLELLSDSRLSRIVKIEIFLAFISLLVIILEILLIFRPMIVELINKNKALKRNNRVLEEYAYIASHDLRTPIRSIHNFLTLFLRSAKSKLTTDELTFLNHIKDSALRMNETTKDLLTYSVSNKLNKEMVDISKVLDFLIQDLGSEIDKSNAEITVQNLPKFIYADKDLIRLLFQNLITNGIKYIPTGEKPKISVSVEETKSNYEFCVKDNGIGIPKKDHQNVFKIFKRLHGKNQYNGTGIGLALCKRIVEGHNGEIWVESKVGEGSTFKFHIPKP